MQKKEINEIRKAIGNNDTCLSRLAGCYVDAEKNITATYKDMYLSLPEEDFFKYQEIFVKSLSGKPGGTLLNIDIPTNAEGAGTLHDALMRLRETELEDKDALEMVYNGIVEEYACETNYLILLGYGAYDIPGKTSDGFEMEDASDEVYTFLVCSICPVALDQPALSFYQSENRFANRTRSWIAGKPENAFLFPAFNDRSTDIHSALFYRRNDKATHPELTELLFMQQMQEAQAQKEAFASVLEDSFDDECSMEKVQSFFENVQDMAAQMEDQESITFTKEELLNAFEQTGAGKAQAEAFSGLYDETFGDKPLPADVVKPRKVEIKTPDVSIRFSEDKAYLVEEKIVDGIRYIMVKAEGDVEINGIHV